MICSWFGVMFGGKLSGVRCGNWWLLLWLSSFR